VVRSVEGAWGAGSGEVAALAFEKEISAVIGALSGRTAHLVEQIATKAGVVFASPWASDHSLSRINIPWFFSCMPDDASQARALVAKVLERYSGPDVRVATVHSENYDSRLAEDAFATIAKASGLERIARIATFGDASVQPERMTPGKGSSPSGTGAGTLESGATTELMLHEVRLAAPDVLVSFLTAQGTSRLMRGLERAERRPLLFGPMRLATDEFLQAMLPTGGSVFVVAPGHWLSVRGPAFEQGYSTRFAAEASAAAAYGYDCAAIVAAAVQAGGTDRARVRDLLREASLPSAVTGPLSFDKAGRRVGSVTVTSVEDLHERRGRLTRP
jgi:ABC-type branched-subunit amino acid transport system substrate-binding protein